MTAPPFIQGVVITLSLVGLAFIAGLAFVEYLKTKAIKDIKSDYRMQKAIQDVVQDTIKDDIRTENAIKEIVRETHDIP